MAHSSNKDPLDDMSDSSSSLPETFLNALDVEESLNSPKFNRKRRSEITPILDQRRRRVTFFKRHRGLIKKAHDLATLCNVEVAVLLKDLGQKRLLQYSSVFEKDNDGNLERKWYSEMIHGIPNFNSYKVRINNGTLSKIPGAYSSEALDESELTDVAYVPQESIPMPPTTISLPTFPATSPTPTSSSKKLTTSLSSPSFSTLPYSSSSSTFSSSTTSTCSTTALSPTTSQLTSYPSPSFQNISIPALRNLSLPTFLPMEFYCQSVTHNLFLSVDEDLKIRLSPHLHSSKWIIHKMDDYVYISSCRMGGGLALMNGKLFLCKTPEKFSLLYYDAHWVMVVDNKVVKVLPNGELGFQHTVDRSAMFRLIEG